MKDHPRASLWLSSIAFVFSSISIIYGITNSEFGVIIGLDKPVVSKHEFITVRNDITGLYLRPLVNIYNDGTKVLRVKKVEAFLKHDKEWATFKNTNPFTIQPSDVYSGNIELIENLRNEERDFRGMLRIEMVNEMLEKYHAQNNNTEPITLSDTLLSKIDSTLESNSDWIEESGKYYLLIMYWLNDDEEPSVKQLYKTSINKHQKKILKYYPKKSYITPNDLFRNNQSVFFFATLDLVELNNLGSINDIYSAYKQNREPDK